MVWQRIFDRFAKTNRSQRRKDQKRRLMLERLSSRALMAADIGALHGFVFNDSNVNGTLDAGEVRTNGVAVTLYRDSGAGNVGTLVTTGVNADTLVFTDTSGANVPNQLPKVPGEYRFENLPAGNYIISQATISGLTPPAPIFVTISPAQAQGIRTELIDSYSATDVSVLANNASPTTVDSTAAASAIGGSRDIQAIRTSVAGNILVEVDSNQNADTQSAGALTISSGGGGVGTALVQYDGIDNSINLTANGLNSASLSGQLPVDPTDPTGTQRQYPGAGVLVRTQAANAGEQVEIRVYTDATNFSTAIIPVPVDAVSFLETFVRFDSFTPTGNGADFSNVGAIEARANLTGNNDITISIVDAQRPDAIVSNLANVQFVALGGQVYLDNAFATSNQNNGVRDTGEAGRDGVTVELYQVTDPNGTVDVNATTALATTTTGANGAYQFTNLLPGNYIVAIPASQFTTGQRLFGFGTSTLGTNGPNDNAPDPDNNVVGDDNGIRDANGNVVSLPITLSAGAEPDTAVDGNDTNANNTVGFGFIPLIDLQITKTLNVDASTVSAGGTAAFDILVTNAGPSDATGVQVSDAIPAGLTFQSISNASGSFTTNGGTAGNPLVVTIGSVPSGTTQSFRIITSIGATQTTDITNVSTVAGNEVETNVANNTDDAIVDLPSSDLSITKSDSPDPVSAGGTLTYTITVTNGGPDAASGVQVTDPLPAGVTFVSGNVGGDATRVAFNATNRTVTANIGTLANNAVATITVVVTVGSATNGPLSNVATVTATPNTDPNPNNNTSTAPTDINRIVDVAVTKTASTSPIAGGQVTYTVVVSNNNPAAPGDARGVVVTDTLNPALTFASFNAQTSGVTQSTGATARDLVFTVGDLPFGATRTFSYVANIASSATGTIPNTAVVTTTDTDTVPTNNTEDEPITLGRTFDLIITKMVDKSNAVPGQDTLLYTITVSHDTDSISDAPAFFVQDVLPAGLSGQVITATTASGTPTFDTTTRTARVDFSGLPIGETRTFTIAATVDATATGNTSGAIVNPATVNAGSTELDTTNNSATATTTLAPNFDVTVTKTTTSTNVGPGDTVVYTVGVSKSGPSQARGVTFSDAVPTGLTFVSGTLNGVTATVSNGTISVPAFNLDNNTPITGTFTFTVNNTAPAGAITNTAVVAATGETNVNNNTASAQVTVTPRADVSVLKTVSAATANTGSPLVYTITVSNTGPSTAAGVQVVDTLPAGVTFVSGTGLNGAAVSAPNANRQITIPGGDLAANGSFTITINATIDATATGQLVNSVAATTTTPETNTANNSANATTTIAARTASLSGVVFVDNNRDGIFNTGDVGRAGVTVQLTGTDTLGAAVTATQVTATGGTYSFTNLPAGTYTVQRTDKPANLLSGAEQLGNNATATVNAVDNAFTQLGLGDNIQATNFNFGLLDEPVSKRRFLASTSGN